jgi:hypothetical protein
VYEEGQRYLMEDGTYATCTVADPVEFGSRTACPFRFARTENTTTGLLEYFYYNGTAWTPVMEINTLQPVSCDSDPVVYQLTGSVWVRFAAQLQWTSGQDAEGGGIEWYDLDEPFTNGELQAGIQFTAPAGALSIRFEVVVGDSCVIAESLAGILECECPPVEFPGPGGAVAGAIVLLGYRRYRHGHHGRTDRGGVPGRRRRMDNGSHCGDHDPRRRGCVRAGHRRDGIYHHPVPCSALVARCVRVHREHRLQLVTRRHN